MMNHVLGGDAAVKKEVAIDPLASNNVLTVEQLSTIALLQTKNINRISAQLRELNELVVQQSFIIKDLEGKIDFLERGV